MGSSLLPPRPKALPISKTCVYKNVGKISISVDIYLPNSIRHGRSHPIMLFIHGGGWIGGNRTDYSRPVLHHFLSLGFVVASMDYRLLPESSFKELESDIRDIEPWLKNNLQRHLADYGLRVDTKKIVVSGGSAGALLALLTPKLWSKPPNAILSLYGPTNMHYVPSLQRGRFSSLSTPPLVPEILAIATNYSKPPTWVDVPKTTQDCLLPRNLISLNFFRREIVAEFLLRGLIRDGNGKLRLPEKGSVGVDEIDEISPIHLCTKYQYPPVYQLIGTTDEIFLTTQITDFHDVLQRQGVKCEKVIVRDVGHAFDIWEEVGDVADVEILRPAVEWVARAVGFSEC